MDEPSPIWLLRALPPAVNGYATHRRSPFPVDKEREPLELPSLPVQRRIANTLSAYDEPMANSRRRIRRSVQNPLSGAWITPGTPITPDHKKCPQSERKVRKNKRISSTNSSGSSSAAKWPPRDISVQCWILYPRSTQRLGGIGPSFGKHAIPHGTVT
jgi:hypothetical protein